MKDAWLDDVEWEIVAGVQSFDVALSKKCNTRDDFAKTRAALGPLHDRMPV
jgi:hypothetical protein